MRRNKQHRFPRRQLGVFGMLLSLGLAATNWYVHQPRAWQQARAENMSPPLAFWISRIGNATADATDTLGITGHDVTAPLATPLATNRLVCAGLPKRLPGGSVPDDITVLNKKGFVIGYSPSLRHPVWVAYHVFPVSDHIPPPRPTTFKPDPAARNSPQHKDYTKTGYDRGHMAPNLAIATRYGKAAQQQSFLTSNICPQRPSLNQGSWRDLEFRVSDLWPACYGDVWVITGAFSAPGGKRLASGIDIPSAFYQIVVAQRKGKIRAFAVCMPQSLRRSTPARATLISIDALEKLAGLDFLSELPDDVENEIEAAVPTRLWPAGFLGTFRLLREHLRSYD